MPEPLTPEQLADWRYQCEERIRRWEKGSAVPEWHLDVRETLLLLDRVRDLEAERLEQSESYALTSSVVDRIGVEFGMAPRKALSDAGPAIVTGIRELKAQVEEWGTKETEQRARAAGLAADLDVATARLLVLEEFRSWAANQDETWERYDHADGWDCERCNQTVALVDGLDVPDHAMCHACCSDIVEELFARARALAFPKDAALFGDGSADEPLTVTPARLASDRVYKTVTVPPHPLGPEFCPWCGAPTGSYTTIEINGRTRSEGVCFKCAGVWAVELINCETPPSVRGLLYDDPRPTLATYCMSCGASGDYRTYAALGEEKP